LPGRAIFGIARRPKQTDIVGAQDRDRSEPWIDPVSKPSEPVRYWRQKTARLEL